MNNEKKNQIFLKAFLKRKNKHALIRKFNPTSNKKNYHHPTFVQYKEISINLFSLYNMKKKIREKKKIVRGKEHKIGNILEGKKLKGKKLVADILDTALLCVIHCATIKKYVF